MKSHIFLFAFVSLCAGGAAAQEHFPPSKTAVFAGGCFWCMQPPFDKVAGVTSTTAGYSGGRVPNPTYEQVSAGGTGHVEAVQVAYDPAKVSYQKLLDTFWRNVDPIEADGQFCDRGRQYRSVIFYSDETERQAAEASKTKIAEQLHAQVATNIVPAAVFYPAEEYHQNYYKKNPLRYKFYRYRCGRDQRLKEVWGDAASH